MRVVYVACVAAFVLSTGCGQKHENPLSVSPELDTRPSASSHWHSDRDLLVVDDTRFHGDQYDGGGNFRPPVGAWPSAAELDTFLFARGGFPWQHTSATSTPGLFAGYEYDTIGTRSGQTDLTVPLETLTRYRHVVWIVDAVGATFSSPGNSPTQPMTALRYMTQSGRTNTLAQYVEGGGQLWLVGGGGAYASTIARNVLGNDVPTTTFTAAAGELASGAFMVDHPHWRSAIRVAQVPVSIQLSSALPASRHPRPNYGVLPMSLDLKTAATDPVQPTRSTATGFYPTTAAMEYLLEPNHVVERRNQSIPNPRYWMVLDSLYQASTSFDPGIEKTCMTNYHGDDNGGVVFSGFDVWSWQRSQCAALVDAVLQGIWGLKKEVAPAATAGDEEELRKPRGRS